jgi:hypothetical protein
VFWAFYPYLDCNLLLKAGIAFLVEWLPPMLEAMLSWRAELIFN